MKQKQQKQVLSPDAAILKALELGLITVDVNAGIVYDQRGSELKPQYPANNGGYGHLSPFPTPPGGCVERRIYVHRVVAFAVWGAQIKGKRVGHIDGNRHDNGFHNLSVMTREQHRKKLTSHMRIAWRFVSERNELLAVAYSDSAALMIAIVLPHLFIERPITYATRNQPRQRWQAKAWALAFTGRAGGLAPEELSA